MTYWLVYAVLSLLSCGFVGWLLSLPDRIDMTIPVPIVAHAVPALPPDWIGLVD